MALLCLQVSPELCAGDGVALDMDEAAPSAGAKGKRKAAPKASKGKKARVAAEEAEDIAAEDELEAAGVRAVC